MNMPTLQFLLTSLTEMQLLSPAQSIYNHAFKNIRKLAMLLRAAISTKTEEAVKKFTRGVFSGLVVFGLMYLRVASKAVRTAKKAS